MAEKTRQGKGSRPFSGVEPKAFGRPDFFGNNDPGGRSEKPPGKKSCDCAVAKGNFIILQHFKNIGGNDDANCMGVDIFL